MTAGSVVNSYTGGALFMQCLALIQNAKPEEIAACAAQVSRLATALETPRRGYDNAQKALANNWTGDDARAALENLAAIGALFGDSGSNLRELASKLQALAALIRMIQTIYKVDATAGDALATALSNIPYVGPALAKAASWACLAVIAAFLLKMANQIQGVAQHVDSVEKPKAETISGQADALAPAPTWTPSYGQAGSAAQYGSSGLNPTVHTGQPGWVARDPAMTAAGGGSGRRAGWPPPRAPPGWPAPQVRSSSPSPVMAT